MASRLATTIYVVMVTPILYNNSYSPQISNMKVRAVLLPNLAKQAVAVTKRVISPGGMYVVVCSSLIKGGAYYLKDFRMESVA